ncbi:MAG: M23 family metallopeptidase [Gammaproteobacteria bacterium]|nr:M23 family metallopeptidase [Gammaproteobacteria bacterium]
MKVIFLSDSTARSTTLEMPVSARWLVPVAFFLCLFLAAAIGYGLALPRTTPLPAELVATWQDEVARLGRSADELRERNALESRAYATHMATLQARLLRMEAVGQRLASAASLDGGEFDFDQEPALGGPFSAETGSIEGSELGRSLDRLAAQIGDRERQLDVLERLLDNRTLASEVSLGGRPIASGYLSSRFGTRADPFDGRAAWHKGVDFTARAGTDVLAVAPGVVTWAGYDKDYGNLVEIRHSDGYRTRYAHNSEYLVKPGDLIRKGQVIAKVGRSGRATGAHLHFEVLADGRPVNPCSTSARRAAGDERRSGASVILRSTDAGAIRPHTSVYNLSPLKSASAGRLPVGCSRDREYRTSRPIRRATLEYCKQYGSQVPPQNRRYQERPRAEAHEPDSGSRQRPRTAIRGHG